MTAQKGTQIMCRACPCLSLLLVSPWRNFTLRKLRKSRGYIAFHTGGWSGAWRHRAATSSCKVGPDGSGTHFLLYALGANPSCFGVILGFMGCAHLSGQDCMCSSNNSSTKGVVVPKVCCWPLSDISQRYYSPNSANINSFLVLKKSIKSFNTSSQIWQDFCYAVHAFATDVFFLKSTLFSTVTSLHFALTWMSG